MFLMNKKYQSVLSVYGATRVIKHKIFKDSAIFFVKLVGVNFYGVFTFINDVNIPYDVYTRCIGSAKIKKSVYHQLNEKYNENKLFLMEKKYLKKVENF